MPKKEIIIIEDCPTTTEYYCEICDYRTTKINYYNYHINESKKHKDRIQILERKRERETRKTPYYINLRIQKAKQNYPDLVNEAREIRRKRETIRAFYNMQNDQNPKEKSKYSFTLKDMIKEQNEILLELLDKREQEEREKQQQSEATPT